MLNSDELEKRRKLIEFNNANKKEEKKELTPEESARLKFSNTKIDLVNHSVKTDDIGLLQYFYPDYKILEKPSLFVDSPVIWTGDAKYLNTLKESGVKVISVTNLAEYSLLNKDTLIQMTFTKWNKPIPKYLYEIKDLLDYDTVLECVKYHWITGKWMIKEFKDLNLFLKFLTNWNESNTLDLSRNYFHLVDNVNINYLDKSFLSFISKVVGVSDGNSKWYKRVANQFKIAKIQNVKYAMDSYVNTNIDNKQLVLLNLINDLLNAK